MRDRRLTPANDRVACHTLQGEIVAPRYVAGAPRQVIAPLADLCGSAAGVRYRQLLLGETVRLLESHEGWAFVQADKDGFVGYIAAQHLGTLDPPSHWVSAASAHFYPAADFKVRETGRLSLGALVSVDRVETVFSHTPLGWIPSVHLSSLSTRPTDPVGVAEQLLGTPYLWGGNSRDGIDCSGLVQLACWICDIDCPADSDLQAASLGFEIDPATPMCRGDLLFWRGHVAWVVDAGRLLHANAGHMATVYEPINVACGRIAAQGGGEVLLRRRLTRPSACNMKDAKKKRHLS